MISKLNKALTVDTDAIERVIKHVTGVCSCSDSLGITEAMATMEQAGMTTAAINDIEADIFGRHIDLMQAAFYAGYRVGRNPDLLILAPEPADATIEPEALAWMPIAGAGGVFLGMTAGTVADAWLAAGGDGDD